jgi:hypothetical protein
VDVIISINYLVCVLFGLPSLLHPSILFILVTVPFFIALWAKPAIHDIVFSVIRSGMSWFAHLILSFVVNGSTKNV